MRNQSIPSKEPARNFSYTLTRSDFKKAVHSSQPELYSTPQQPEQFVKKNDSILYFSSMQEKVREAIRSS